MADPNPINNDEISTNQVEEKKFCSSLSLETLVLLVHAERLKYLQEKSQKEFSELKDRQDAVAKLHKLLQKIHAQTNSDTGELKITEELKQLLKEAKDLGVEIPEGKELFSKSDREKLESNIQLTTEDLNVKNEMQLQTVNRLMDERYQSYQLARSILKPLHDAKMSAIKGFSR